MTPSPTPPFVSASSSPPRRDDADAQGIGAFLPMYDVNDPVLREARRMYQRVLAGWASDVLMLRRTGALSPRWSAARAGCAPRGRGSS